MVPPGVSMAEMINTSTQGGDMTRTTRIPKAEITGLSGAMMKRFAKKSLGEVPSPLGVYWHCRIEVPGTCPALGIGPAPEIRRRHDLAVVRNCPAAQFSTRNRRLQP
jgi:hypothetical protein